LPSISNTLSRPAALPTALLPRVSNQKALDNKKKKLFGRKGPSQSKMESNSEPADSTVAVVPEILEKEVQRQNLLKMLSPLERHILRQDSQKGKKYK
jgi:hypothetical protein